MKGQYIIAYDLGTGGNKASLYDFEGRCLAENSVSYPTQYPATGWHEQQPEDWWNAVVESTNRLLKEAPIERNEICCCGISGHSLGVVPMDRTGKLLREATPIWSDSRPLSQSNRFFETVDENEWYLMTGNGFPPPLYSVFKMMWYRDNEPEMFKKIHKVIGTKDFINYKLTGNMVTDYSYASGCGVYDLVNWEYSDAMIAASGLPKDIFPDIVPSTEVIGELTPEAVDALNLPAHIKVVAGGVDNSCMALGARSFKEGRVYNALGSSSWVAVTSGSPLLDVQSRPYVFTHVIPGLFMSATSIFSAGTSFRWLRDQFCQSIVSEAELNNVDPYELMTAEAENSPVGSNSIIFNPSLAGGNLLDASPNIRGAFMGLDLGHTRADVIRSAMEGVALGLRVALDELIRLTSVEDEMTVVGGISRSKLWRQMLADIYQMNIVKTNIDQQAAALGAAALAAVGTGLWSDFEIIDEIHAVEDIAKPIPRNSAAYSKLLPIYKKASQMHSEIGDMLTAVSRGEKK
ncbi:MAG: pentose kinase [bacterium]|nr:pentose kinase [bacterium]